MTTKSTSLKPRIRPIRIRRLRAGFRAVVAGQTYTEPTISALLDRLINAGHHERQISWLNYQRFRSVQRYRFDTVREAAWLLSHFRHSVAQLGPITGAQLSKIEALGGRMVSVNVDFCDRELFYAFPDHVIGTMTIAHLQGPNWSVDPAMWRAWRRFADNCPTLDEAANRYLVKGDESALDTVRVLAKMAA